MKLLSLQTKELEMNLDKKKIQIFARRWSFLLQLLYGVVVVKSSESGIMVYC